MIDQESQKHQQAPKYQEHGTEVEQTTKPRAKMVNDGLYSRFASSRPTNIRFKQILLEFINKFIDLVRNKPITFLAGFGLIISLIFYCFSESKTNELKDQQEDRISRDRSSNEISGVERAVDPRAKWTEEVLNEVKNLKGQLENLIENKYLDSKSQIDEITQKLQSLENRPDEKTILWDGNNLNPDEQMLGAKQIKKELPIESRPVRREFGYAKRISSQVKKETEDYITTGSFARGLLLTGVVVGTGTNNASSPEPIMVRLVDTANFSKGYKTNQIKEAILIGSCNGDISSERAKCRLETVSLVNNKGDIIEKKIEGWLIGEDGRPGIKGIVVDRSSDVARMAVLNGVLGGIAQFFQNQATNGIFPISPITGQQNALKAKDALKGGVYSGTGNALEKLADFAIKRAESMSPVIVIGSGRVVDVVFRKGFDLRQNDEEMRLAANTNYSTNSGHSLNKEDYSGYQNYNSISGNINKNANRISSFSQGNPSQGNFSKTNLQLRERFIKDDNNENQLVDTSEDNLKLEGTDQIEGGL